MRKRFLSLLCVLALFLGLLPVTALAVENAPDKLYVGGTLISQSGYWISSEGSTTWTHQSNEPSDGSYIHYDGSGTLTLHNATITGNNSSSESSGAGIYAVGKTSRDVALTIVLEGNSTISGDYGIYILANQQSGRAASLTIEGNYGLSVSGAANYGILVYGNSGNASLTIKNATVTASTSRTYAAGVGVQSYSTNSTLSIAVNSGSLTASANVDSSSGIEFVNSSSSGTLETSLTVSNSAVVKANNGITCTDASKPTPSGTGIVFDGTEGTVYGNVTLDKSLTINQGETLTIPEDASLTCNEKLTNNGTIINAGGTLSGTPSGSGTVVNAPTIGTQPASQSVTVGETAEFSVIATGENLSYQWQQKTSSSDWADIQNETSATYAITNTAIDMSGTQYRCVVSNSAGSVTSDAATLTVNAATVPVTGVTLNKNTLQLYTGQSETLTATVEPGNATNKNVTWSSDNEAVATVDNSGKVTAVGAGEATITVTTEDGGKTATCHVKVIQPTYSISADTESLNFGSVYVGYTQPTAKTVTITNDGNQQVTVTLPTANDFVITAGTGFTDSTATLAPNGTATFTVQPKAGLAVGTYSENITVTGSESATVTIPATFTVEQRDNTPYYGITVNDPANGAVTCYAKSAAKGAEVTLTVKPDVGYVLDKLTVTDAGGKTVDVTKVDEKTYTFVMPGSKVTVEAVFAPTAVEPSDLPFTDVSTSDWFYSAVKFVYENGLMDGVAGNLFAPNATLNRAMAVTILYRLEGSPDLDGENLGYPFADVDGDTWYSDAVYWARLNGIVDGVENNHFNPTGSLTREQMATILYRYAQYKGADVSAAGDLSGFVDSANVSPWAADAVQWAVGTGLVNGVEGSALAPQGTSTRAQAAAVLMRLSQAMGQ